MAERMSQFVYDCLQQDEIRLLQAEVGINDTIQWSLETVRLPTPGTISALEFDALSYTWGDPAETFSFICNNKELRIHRNLHDALPYLARRRSPRPIWIDALCINQSDEEEKLAQVHIMHGMYRQASRVWVWLGCASEHSETAIALLPRLTQASQEVKRNKTTSTKYTTSNTSRLTLESFGLPELSSPIWSAINAIICNKWFSRLWIVQEFALARDVQFILGSHEVDPKVLEDVLIDGYEIEKLIDAKGQKLKVQLLINSMHLFIIKNNTLQREALDETAGFEESIPRHLISTVFLMTGTHHCFDPRDRVWGILGFLDGHQPDELRIDSGMSLTDLYTRLAHYLFTKADMSKLVWWRLLDRATFPNKRPGLPSWCPDFHQQIQYEHETNSISTTSPGNRQASRSRGNAQPGTCYTEIILQGTVFDILTSLYPLAPLPEKSVIYGKAENRNFMMLQSWLRLREWDDLLITAMMKESGSAAGCPTIPLVPDDETKRNLDMYWRTIIGNETNHGSYSFTYETFIEFQKALRRFSALAEKNNGLLKRLLTTQQFEAANAVKLDADDEETMAKMDPETPFLDFYTQLCSTLIDKRLFSTLAGRLGFGPVSMQEGDVLCVFDGASTAHVLRRADGTNSGAYTLVGESYVHRMMDGEIDSMGLTKEDITLI